MTRSPHAALTEVVLKPKLIKYSPAFVTVTTVFAPLIVTVPLVRWPVLNTKFAPNRTPILPPVVARKK